MSVTSKTNVDDAIIANDIGNEKGILSKCIEIQGTAKDLAPVDKGQLKGSITYKTSLQSGLGSLDIATKRGEGFVGTNTEYAIYQEFGTRFQKAQPYLRPAGLIAAQPGKFEEVIKFFNQEMGKKLPKA